MVRFAPGSMERAGMQLEDGRYVVTGVLGEGAQGATLEAVDKRAGRPVAVKEFTIRGASSWKDVELAEREAKVLAELDHPALPRHIDHFEENGRLYLVMERIEGESLGRLRSKGARSSDEEVEWFLADAADVLAYLHARRPPIIHRDIKPSNVIRRPDGTHAFVDFGSVRDTLKPEGGSTVVGTFGYMAPEQFQGRALPASDVYAVGATAISMLAGCEPDALPHRGLAIDVRAALNGVARPALVRALERMVDPNPDTRASDIRELLTALDVRRTEPGRRTTTRPGPAYRGPPWFIGVFLTMGLITALVVVFLALRVTVPLFLSLLSIVFGSGVARAAANVSRAGENAGRALGRALGWATGSGAAYEPLPARRARVVSRRRVRVAGGSDSDDELASDTDVEEAVDASARWTARERR